MNRVCMLSRHVLSRHVVSRHVLSRHVVSRHMCVTCRPLAAGTRLSSTAALPSPSPEGEPRQFPAKIQDLVSQIGQLTLVEVADLNQLLKQELNIQAAAPVMVGAAATQPREEEEEVEVKREKTSFTVKLVKFDDSKKIALIKEIKNLIPGTNLVQAKKFVESLPQPVGSDIGKDEAEKLKETLTKVGGVVEID